MCDTRICFKFVRYEINHNYSVVGYATFMPAEIKRKMTPLSERIHWKMRQTRNFFLYLSYPIFAQFRERLINGEFIMRQLRLLLHTIRSVGGTSCLPIDPAILRKARQMARTFFSAMIAHYGVKYATWKAHSFLHSFDDPENYGCHAERISTEQYETFHQAYRGLVHPGPKVHLQLKYASCRTHLRVVPLVFEFC